MVQEIHKLKPAEKVVILGSIKSDKEMSITFSFGKSSRIFETSRKLFLRKTIKSYAFSENYLTRIILNFGNISRCKILLI